VAGCRECGIEPFSSFKVGEFFYSLLTTNLSRVAVLHEVIRFLFIVHLVVDLRPMRLTTGRTYDHKKKIN
jgi:hypothetical protein